MPATRARTCTSREPSVRPTASKLTGTSRGWTASTLTVIAWDAFLASPCFASPWLQVVALELDQHAERKGTRHLGEQAVLALEVVVDGLLGDAGAARDLVHARGIAVGEKRIRGGAQHALAVLQHGTPGY